MTIRIVTVVGARPQFIKSGPVSKALRNLGLSEYIIHTGQHYDYSMSGTFFDQLGLPTPDINLDIRAGTHAQQTGKMLIAIEDVLLSEAPDLVLVYGDTNSTIAAALAAVKLSIEVAHVEAGLRSFNKEMPEEHNRILTDHCSTYLFCPTKTAVDQLALEGIVKYVHLVGDTMYDAVRQSIDSAQRQSDFLRQHQLRPQQYLLATIHRPHNTDDPENLKNILRAFADTGQQVIFPVHPRTQKNIAALQGEMPRASNLHLIEPLGYWDMLVAQQHARYILTDSGGIQKEAYFLRVPCITLRNETEWIETLNGGWNVLVGTDPGRIVDAANRTFPSNLPHPDWFGDGYASEKIANILAS